jgi:hypothetical protein
MRFLAVTLVVVGCAWAGSPALAASSSQGVEDACPPGQVQGDDGLCVQTKGARMGYDFVPDAETAQASTAQSTAVKPKSTHQKTTKAPPSANAPK